MKIDSVQFKEYSVTFTGALVTSQGAHTQRKGIIVRVHADDGVVGVGEIAPLSNYSVESLPDARQSAVKLARDISGSDIPADFSSLENFLNEAGGYPPSVIFGFETALAEIAAKSRSLPLCRWISPDSASHVPVNAVLYGDMRAIREQVESLGLSKYRVFKLKVGAGSLENDIRRVESVSEQLGEGATLRLDANRAWDFDHAVSVLKQLKGLRIEYVEEPLCRNDIQRLQDLQAETEMSFALDETVQNMALWERHVESDAISAAIIKPTIAGGISKSIELCKRVAKLGKKAIVTTTFESGVGTAASLHLAASFGEDIHPCGLDTIRYLSDSLICEHLPVEDGCIRIPYAPGLGVTLRSGIFD
jgi:O-succinylbenzoate synthase